MDRKTTDILNYLRSYDGPPMTIMEVCGSHTGAIAKAGIPSLLSKKISLISGPGCPVCVTPSAYIDRLIELAEEPGTTIVTFGDLLRVPGSLRSLNEAKADGADVRMVYSPFDTLEMAKNEPDRLFIFAAVGFETTMPVYALMIDQIIEQAIPNIRFLTSLKTMPPVIRSLCLMTSARIDGFIAPGHVSVVTGSRVFEPLASEFKIPFAVAGFKGEEILQAIYVLVLSQGQGRVMNLYPSVVTREGNGEAQALIARYFEEGDAPWRGMGEIPASGLYIRSGYSRYDAGSRGLNDDNKRNKACRCDRVLIGAASPTDCPLYGKACTPLTPQGACMVSPEGSCQAWYLNNRT